MVGHNFLPKIMVFNFVSHAWNFNEISTKSIWIFIDISSKSLRNLYEISMGFHRNICQISKKSLLISVNNLSTFPYWKIQLEYKYSDKYLINIIQILFIKLMDKYIHLNSPSSWQEKGIFYNFLNLILCF